MYKCPELSKLPKAGRIKSLNFKRQTPGSCTPLVHHGFISKLLKPLDPSHPSVKRKTYFREANYPHYGTQSFELYAYPMAMLGKPERVWTEPFDRPLESWDSRVKRMADEWGKNEGVLKGRNTSLDRKPDQEFVPIKLVNDRPGRVSISMMSIMSKQKLGKTERHIRLRLIAKIKTALNYIITRGARTEIINGKKKIVFSDLQEPEESKWVLRGWTYLFLPTLEIYLMPYHDLIPLVRNAMETTYRRGEEIEKYWKRLELKRLGLDMDPAMRLWHVLQILSPVCDPRTQERTYKLPRFSSSARSISELVQILARLPPSSDSAPASSPPERTTTIRFPPINSEDLNVLPTPLDEQWRSQS